MKTAKEWANEMNHGCARNRPDHIALSEIMQIQLDAMKEGARRAAEKLEERAVQMNTFTLELAISEEAKAILTAANNWTEKDL